MTALGMELAHLSGRQRALFDALQGRGWVPVYALELALFDGACAKSSLHWLVCRTRRNLAGTGWVIQTAPGTGAYRLLQFVDAERVA